MVVMDHHNCFYPRTVGLTDVFSVASGPRTALSENFLEVTVV